MKYKIIMLILAILFFAGRIHAQKNALSISGKVISAEDSYPLEGVTIQVKKTKSITGTMQDGAFSLNVAKGDTITISFDGYETKEIVVSDETYYEIQLKRGSSPSSFLSDIERFDRKLLYMFYY